MSNPATLDVIDPEFLAMLVCPKDRTPLHVAPRALLERVNALVAERKLTNASGATLEKPLDNGLVRADNAVLYPIEGGIVTLLADEGIPLAADLAELARA